MAKRFRDTKLSREAWYRKLIAIHKCTWDFLCDECDEAGMWPIDMDAIEFYVGEVVQLADFVAAVNSDRTADRPRVEVFAEDKIWITGFVEFQYGQLSEACIPHRKIISLLKKYNLLDRVYVPYTKGIDTLKEKKGIGKDKEEDKEGRGSGGNNRSRQPNIKPEALGESHELKMGYKVLITEVKEIAENKEQRRLVADFITEYKPAFMEPYMDLWNLSAKMFCVSQVEAISDSRVRRFKTRIREPMFDFIKILAEIKNSNYLRGKTTDWKVDWDWLFENDTNYLKILEGKYRNTTNG